MSDTCHVKLKPDGAGRMCFVYNAFSCERLDVYFINLCDYIVTNNVCIVTTFFDKFLKRIARVWF
jgi:hypothetical protein